MPALEKDKRYTYQDYCQWGEDKQWEIIDGIPYNMAPAPIERHQRILLWLGRKIGNALEGKKCIPYIAPFDVVLSESDIVQPDLLVVCDPQKITTKNIQGAPDLVIEIISPSTIKRDRWTKKRLYEQHGVKEYIIVDGEGAFSEQYILDEYGKFQEAIVVDFDEELTIQTAENLPLILKEALDIPPFNQEKVV
jgi:Uma2 family endonuclease